MKKRTYISYQVYVISVLILSFLNSFTGIAQKKNNSITENHFVKYAYSDLTKAYQIAKIAVEKYEKESNDKKLLESYSNFSEILFLKRKKDRSFEYCVKALELALKLKNYEKQAELYIRLGRIHTEKFQYQKALNKFKKASQIIDKHKFYKQKSDLHTASGLLYQVQENPTARSEFHKSIHLSDSIQYSLGAINAYNALATSFIPKHHDSTEIYYKKAMQKALQSENVLMECILRINLAYIDLVKNDNEKAKKVLLESAKTSKKIGHDAGLFWTNMFLGMYYKNIGNYQESVNSYKLAVSDYGDLVNDSRKIWAYDLIYTTYYKIEDYEKAIFYKDIYHNLKDSILNIKKFRAFNELKIAHEIDNKNNRIAFLKKEKQLEIQEKQQILFLTILILIIATIVLLLFKQRIKHQKQMRKKENELHKKDKQQLIHEQEIQKKIALIEGKNEESNRISRELHDGLGGHLASIRMELSQVNETLQRQDIKKINHKLLNAVSELRKLSHDLDNNYAADKNFKSLLFELIKEYQHVYDFRIQLALYPENILDNFPSHLTHHLYRVIQEVLTNINKHAYTKEAVISFTKHTKQLSIIIEDNGIGFDVQKNTNGIGLKNIKKRIDELSGQITIDSSIGKGTHILIDIPL